MQRQEWTENDFEVLRIHLAEAFDRKDWEKALSISRTIDLIQCALWE